MRKQLLLPRPQGLRVFNSLRELPQARSIALPQGLSFDVPAESLARWNAGVVAKEEDEKDTSISVYDPIGFDPWTGGGVTAKRIAAALRTIGKKTAVTVNINSPGGDFFEGLAIYNLLREHEAEVTVRVVGLAASAASLIAMAGDRIEVARAGFIMIHNVWSIAIGNRNDLRDAADIMESFDDALADVYVARTGREKKEVVKMMDKETWFSGSQAVEKGFADALLPADAVEEKDGDDAADAANALRVVDTVLAKAGMPRSQRRAMLNRIKGATQDAGALGGSTQDAGANATQDAGADAKQSVNSMLTFLSNLK